MATILRSLRFTRSPGGFAKRLVLNQKRNIIISVIRYDSAGLSVSVDDRTPNLYSNVGLTKVTSHFKTNMEKMRMGLQRRGWIWKEEIVQVINDIENNGKLNAFDACCLIRWCGECVIEISPHERMQLVLELWDTFNVYNFPMDVSHYNALIKVYEANDYTFTPVTLLTEMQSKRIKPNIITYETIIAYYCKRGDIPNVKKILELMKEEGVSVTESILNSLILGHSEAGDLDSSINTLKMMKNNKMTLTMDTYTALMCAYAKVNDVDTIEDIISVCKSKRLNPSNQSIWKVLYALAANNHLNCDNKIFDHLHKIVYHSSEIISILKLMEIGSIDVALHRFKKVLDTVSNSNLCDCFVNLLIKKLIWSNTESNKIVEICTRFNDDNFGWKNLQKAVYNSYFKNDESLSLTLLRNCRNANYTIRQHYFWPLLVWKGNKHDFQGILDILSCMVTEFKLAPNIDTVKDYVLPYAFGNTADIVKVLINHQVNQTVVHNAFVYHSLSINKTRNVIAHMTEFPSRYYYESLQKPLRRSLCETLDVASFVQISKRLYKRNELNSVVNDDTISNSMMSMDEQLMDFLHYCPNHTYVLRKVLDHLLQTGTPISRAIVDAVTRTTGRVQMEGIVDKLQQERIRDSDHVSDKEDLNELLQRINAQKKGLIKIDMESKLMGLLCATMDNTSVPLSKELYSFAISYACKHDDLKYAEKFMELAKRTYSNFGDTALHLEYASLLAKRHKFDDVCQYVLQHLGLPVTHTTHLHATRLLKTLGEVPSFSFDQFKKMFYILKSMGYVTVLRQELPQLIQDYIDKGKLAMAGEIFCLLLKEIKNPKVVQEQICKALIMNGDHELLQRVINEILKYEDDTVVTSNLFFNFVECNHLDQARAMLETYKLHNHMELWSKRIEEYERKNDFQNLEKFLVVTKGLSPMQRLNLYDTLIHICVKKNEPQRGLNAWTTMRKENLNPSESALYKLGNLLKKNNQDIPFAYGEMKASDTATENKENENIVDEVKEALRNDDLQKSENC